MSQLSQSIRIGVNCGGPAVDGLSADQPYSPGGWGYDRGLPWSVWNTELAPRDGPVISHFGYPHAFETYHYHAGAPFHYRFDLPNGYYELRLYFLEPRQRSSGGRVFDVRINQKTALRHFDIVKESGGIQHGVERVFHRVPVTNGQLEVTFVTVEHDPLVSAIIVTREGEDCPPSLPTPDDPATSEGLHRIYSDNLKLIRYYGSWSTQSGTDGPRHPGYHRSKAPGSAADFHFGGTHIRWIGSRGEDHGTADVFIDGKRQASVDTYAPQSLRGQVLFESSNLSTDRQHTIRIQLAGSRNAASTDCYLEIEAFECELAIDVDTVLASAAYAELATIKSGDKPYPPLESWRKIEYQASAPEHGVSLQPGLFKTAVERNAAYLMTCFAYENWVSPTGSQWWRKSLPASNEGRLLAGAGHTLRWEERGDLRDLVTSIIDAIAERQRPDGYVLPFEEASLAGEPSEKDERRNYDRTMFTKGLIAAFLSGDQRAAGILRRFYDWFDRSPYVNNLLEGSLGCQGHVASTLVGLMPFGKADDLLVGERFYVQNWLLDALANEDPLCIYKYPLDRPHCYYVTLIEAYLDHYRANGDPRYLAAARGAWNCYRENFIHVGGSAAISEAGYGTYPPKSYLLGRGNGELCGSVFWIDLCHRFLQLYPEDEAFAAEIERSIYNVALANQEASGAIRYHARLHGNKESGQLANTCCEVMGSGLYGRLPQYIYSIADDGVYVNLYEPSSLTWQHQDTRITLQTVTSFPYDSPVSLGLTLSVPNRIRIRLRIPGWAGRAVPILINGEIATEGRPGTYVTLDRVWASGDHITLALPMDFRLTRYEGFDQIPDGDRYALEYGPVLLALAGPTDDRYRQPDGSACPQLRLSPEDLPRCVQPVRGRPLHFQVNNDSDHVYLPYWEISTETFSCFPILRG